MSMNDREIDKLIASGEIQVVESIVNDLKQERKRLKKMIDALDDQLVGIGEKLRNHEKGSRIF